MTWLTVLEYLCHKLPRVCSTCRKHFPIFSSFMTYHVFVTRLTRRVPLVEQELMTLPEHLCSSPVFCGVRITRSLVLCVCFVYRCLSFWTFSFGHAVVCSSSIYGFWLPFWYLQTLLGPFFYQVLLFYLKLFMVNFCTMFHKQLFIKMQKKYQTKQKFLYYVNYLKKTLVYPK